jgi:hypothetical protein
MTTTRPILHVLFGALACLALPRAAGAYPISPVPLWELTEESELIVLGEVTEVRESMDAGERTLRDAPSSSRLDGPGSVARITVRETWKGEAEPQVEVSFDPHYICPAPPRYVTGKVVAAFLSREDDRWFTVGLSYGTLYPTADEVTDLRDRVREAIGLQKAGVVDPRERVAWHVRAAARRATRWHGLYGLKPSGDSLHYYYDARRGVRMADVQLSAEEFDAIARGFVEEPSLDRTLPMILVLFEGRPHHALDRAAIAAVEALLAKDRIPWWIGEALEPLLRRLGDADPKGRLEPLGDRFEEVSAQVVRDIWGGAKCDLLLPDIPAAPSLPDEIGGVGENTPS